MARIVQQGIIQVAGSGETGVQVNEFEAAIKSITSSTTVGAVFVYDTRNDSDSGAWRKKTSHTSWAREAASATRSSRSEFPSVALIVSDSASGVTIYDLDDPAMPMWMVFNGLSGDWATKMLWASGNAAGGGLVALNGRVFLGRTWVDFASDEGGYYHVSYLKKYGGGIGDRHATSITFEDTSGAIASSTVNDVDLTYLEGGELDSLGLVRPVAALATDGGVSVIHPNGSVYDIAGTGQTHDDVKNVFFTEDGMVGYNFEASSSVTHSWSIGLRKIPFADETIGGWATTTNLERYTPKVGGAVSGLTTQTSEYTSSNSATNAVTPTGKNGLAIGYADRLSIVKRNPANMEEGMVSYHTSGYCTGYQLGDIRFAGLANHRTQDRSVKNNHLTQFGSVGAPGIHGSGSDQTAYGPFSADDYLYKANDTDFDFGDNDFSISLWVKNTNWTGDQRLLGRSESTTAKRLSLYASGTTLTLYLRDGAATSVSANVLQNNVWQHIFACRKSSKLYLYVDGRSVATPVASTTNITPTVASALVIGAETFDNRSSISNPLTNGSLSLVRISATAPTPTQVADIYEAEKPLFRSGAKCLLQGGDNEVKALSFDKSTGLLTAGTGVGTTTSSGATIFRGLEVVDTFKGQDYSTWNSGSMGHVSTAGGVSAYNRPFGSSAADGGVVLDLPAIDVRGDINTADSKLPDDGKFHFSGVTTDTTATNIGIIPIAENERYTVRAKIIGQQYNDQDGEWIKVNIEREFYRDIGANFGVQTINYKLSDASTASMHATTTLTGDSNNILIQVTGKGSTRMQWNAEVEVQRISEKQYER